MGLLFLYNVESVRARWRSTIVAILGIAGAVGVFVAMLALARGFEAALVTSGSPHNAMIRRAGATSEIDSMVTLQQLHVIEDAPEIAHGTDGPLVSAEVVAVASLPLRKSGTDANVQLRGVSTQALSVHGSVHVAEGRFLKPGLYELVVGRTQGSYSNLDVGSSVRLGEGTWQVVGIFDAGGSSFDSELWADADLVNRTYQRPLGIHQTVSAQLTSHDSLGALKTRLAGDPRMRVQVERETEYYARASQMRRARLTLAASLFLAASAGAASGASWRVSQGEIRVLCPLTLGGSFEAKTAALAGSVSLATSRPAAFVGELSVDLTTLDSGIGLRNEHMRGNYLEVGKGAGFDKAVISHIHLGDVVDESFSCRTSFTGRLALHGATAPHEQHRDGAPHALRGSGVAAGMSQEPRPRVADDNAQVLLLRAPPDLRLDARGRGDEHGRIAQAIGR